MKKKDYLILSILQLCVILCVARYQTIPGNIDADYYFMGAVRLAQGHGFTENYIWNYFNDPTSIPQPSFSYWMPLASIFSVFGMWLTGSQSFFSGRLVFILLSILIPPLTAALAYHITARRDLAIVSGLISVFSGFYLPYLPITENYSVFMVLGALYFLNMGRNKRSAFFALGVLSGLMSLARSDGIIWLFLTFLSTIAYYWRDNKRLSKSAIALCLINLSIVMSGFLLIMLPWYLRNAVVFGAPMSISTGRALWLTNYYQTFIYPASQLTYQTWLASSWKTILYLRFVALQRILYTIITVQSALILLPFILLGAWKLRNNSRVRLGMIAWAILIFVFTMVFAAAGVRGSFIHAVSALQTLLWVLAPIGLDLLLLKLQRWKAFRDWRLGIVFQPALVLALFLISLSSINALVIADGWQSGELTYPKAESFLLQQNIQPSEPVMVMNPPGYTMMTNRPAVMFPYGGEAAILGVARQFSVRYIVLGNLDSSYDALYNRPDLYPSIQLIDQVDDLRIYKVTSLP